MATYIEDHPNPHKRQYTAPRRTQVTGAIVVHTAESTTDTTLPDGGAEAVARFISQRTDAGSYHSIVDSDSIVRVVPYEWEAWHEGTGGNRWSLGLSFACQADQWPTLPREWVDGALRNGASEAARMAYWVRAENGITIPARRITPAQYRAGQPGFAGHGELDPTRRHDPGAAFPWTEFLDLYATKMQGGPMPADRTAQISEWQRTLLDHGANLGTTGLNNDGVDGDFGPLTLNASKTVLSILTDQVAHWSSEAERLQGELDDLEAGKLSTEDARLVENLAAFIRHTMSEAT